MTGGELSSVGVVVNRVIKELSGVASEYVEFLSSRSLGSKGGGGSNKDRRPEYNKKCASLLTCPLTGQPFEDPVLLLQDGYTYSRNAISKYLLDNASSSADDESTGAAEERSRKKLRFATWIQTTIGGRSASDPHLKTCLKVKDRAITLFRIAKNTRSPVTGKKLLSSSSSSSSSFISPLKAAIEHETQFRGNEVGFLANYCLKAVLEFRPPPPEPSTEKSGRNRRRTVSVDGSACVLYPPLPPRSEDGRPDGQVGGDADESDDESDADDDDDDDDMEVDFGGREVLERIEAYSLNLRPRAGSC
jgi:hypothetical protein